MTDDQKEFLITAYRDSASAIDRLKSSLKAQELESKALLSHVPEIEAVMDKSEDVLRKMIELFPEVKFPNH